MSIDNEQLQRYLDGELSPEDAERMRARLAESPELRRALQELQSVGQLLRAWAQAAESRAGALVEPTLTRVAEAERARSRLFSALFVAAVLLLGLLPWSGASRPRSVQPVAAATPLSEHASVERIDAGPRRATVFVLRATATPVVWLTDDVDGAPMGATDPG